MSGGVPHRLIAEVLVPLGAAATASGGDGVDDLPVGEDVAVEPEVGRQVDGGPGHARTHDEAHARLIQGRQIGGRQHAGVRHDHQVLDPGRAHELPDDRHDGGRFGPVALPTADPQGEAAPVHQQTHDDLRIDPALLGVADPAQVVLLVGLEVQGGHVVQAQAQVTAPGDAGQTGRRDPGAPVALDAAGQGPEQGAPGHRPDTALADHAGDLLLAGGLDAAGQRHLLEALVPAHRLTQPQALVRPGQRIPQQGAALGVDHRARDAGPGAQGLKIQGRLPRQCGDPVASGPHQNGQLRLVMGRAQVLHDPPHPVLLGHDLHGRGSRSGAHLPDERAHTPTLQPPISAPHPPPRPHHANEKPPSRRDVAKTGTSQARGTCSRVK